MDGPLPRRRIASLDLLRGLVMVLMALDHARDFFTLQTAPPEDLPGVGPALFFTRWVTHFCAPTFVFLAGTSAWLHGRGKSRGALSLFLLTRGVWLIALEVFVVFPGWLFDAPLRWLVILQVIWAIGASMCCLALLVHLPRWALLAVGAAMVLGHNALDATAYEQALAGTSPVAFDLGQKLWTIAHGGAGGFVVAGRFVAVTYPLVPWIGVMALGYLFGGLVDAEPAARRRRALSLGLALCAAFVLLRLWNGYGDPREWSAGEGTVRTLVAFLNCEKYPPSLAFLLMTLGPALLVLAAFEGLRGAAAEVLAVFGRVPLFYYLLHVPLLNLMHVLYLGLAYGHWDWSGGLIAGPPEGFEPALWRAYVAWALAVALLYLPCRAYGRYKRRSRNPWLSYL